MKLSFTLSTDESIALRRFASETGETGEDLEVAARLALREYLISVGMLEPMHELDEDTETVGEA